MGKTAKQSSKHAPEPPELAIKQRGHAIQVRVDDAIYDRLKHCAKAETISITAYVRRMIHNYTPGL